MRVLTTGSSGFLGRHFEAMLVLEGGHDLWGVDIVPNPIGLHSDIQDLEEWLSDFEEDVDLVIHMAGVVGGREKIEGDPLYNADQLRLDSVMFRWAVQHAKTMIYPSSSAVYPINLQTEFSPHHPLHEGMFSANNPNFFLPDEMYGMTKLMGEYLAMKAAGYGLNTLCIRPFSGYGPGQGFEYPVPSIARRALQRQDPLEVWGSGSQKRDFVHVYDLVKATAARVSAGVTGYETMNIGSGWGVSFHDLALLFAELVGYKPEIVNLDDKPQGVYNRVADNQRMKRYYPDDLVTLREGLKSVLEDVEKRMALEAI